MTLLLCILYIRIFKLLYCYWVAHTAIEALGMSLPHSSSTPAEDALKLDECRRAGSYITL